MAERLDINIEYGYHAMAEYSDLLEEALEEDFILLGKIKKEGSCWHFRLIDEQYQQKALYAKFGDTLFEKEAYWYWERVLDDATIKAEKESIFDPNFELTAIIALDSNSSLSIYKEVISSDLFYYSRWWSFTDIMQGNNYLYDEQDLRKFRQSVRNSTLALGGDKVYYVNDQCPHLKGVGQGDESEYTWKALERYIHSRKTLEVLSISAILTDKNYQREVKTKNQRNLAFYDDFEDLDGKDALFPFWQLKKP
ncbi:hypothetical protein [Flavobacterium sp. N1994]|uniref:hypothetical protein n=1 Tax=Flavobacterium sp. N1994 TaxID=2986827 RepID=UPI002223D1E6|nr:hypothetical protein [Flavobacterium sp. N1994]